MLYNSTMCLMQAQKTHHPRMIKNWTPLAHMLDLNISLDTCACMTQVLLASSFADSRPNQDTLEHPPMQSMVNSHFCRLPHQLLCTLTHWPMAIQALQLRSATRGFSFRLCWCIGLADLLQGPMIFIMLWYICHGQLCGVVCVLEIRASWGVSQCDVWCHMVWCSVSFHGGLQTLVLLLQAWPPLVVVSTWPHLWYMGDLDGTDIKIYEALYMTKVVQRCVSMLPIMNVNRITSIGKLECKICALRGHVILHGCGQSWKRQVDIHTS